MFATAINKVLKVEGGFVNDKRDSGGATNFGITEAVARANGYSGDMAEMTVDYAKSIYKLQYWDTLRLDEVDVLSPAVAEELFDTGINMGIGVAGKFLQRCLNALNRNGQDYPDLVVDGLVGPGTVNALRSFLARRGATGEVALMRALNALQGARYIELAEARAKDEAFLLGWLLNRVTI